VIGSAGCSSGPAASPPKPGPKSTACGAGPAVLELGLDNPFTPNPSLRYPIIHGPQGGHHIEVSLRVTGGLDPDHVDLDLSLWVAGRETAAHRRDDRLFTISSAGCGYDRARMILVDEQNQPLDPDRFGELTAAPVRLKVKLTTPAEDVDQEVEITLVWP